MGHFQIRTDRKHIIHIRKRNGSCIHLFQNIIIQQQVYILSGREA